MPCSCVRSPGDKGSTTRRRGSGAQDRRRVSPSSAWDRKPQHDLATAHIDPVRIVPRGRRDGSSRTCLLRFKARPKARLSTPNPMHACSGFARQKPSDCEEKRAPRERHSGTEVQSELDPTARIEKPTLTLARKRAHDQPASELLRDRTRFQDRCGRRSNRQALSPSHWRKGRSCPGPAVPPRRNWPPRPPRRRLRAQRNSRR